MRQTGASYTQRLLVLCLLPNGLPFSRCGFAVSRRLGKAVERNRVRRRMREAVRLLWDLVAPGWDLVWVARPAVKSAEFAELQAACVHLLHQAGALLASEGTKKAA